MRQYTTASTWGVWPVGSQYAQVLFIPSLLNSISISISYGKHLLLSLSFSHPMNRFCPRLQMAVQIGFTLPP